jgi:alpha 1,3-glucosidase
MHAKLLFAGSLFLSLLLTDTFALKSGDFKTCSQAGFCRRGRALSARAKENHSWRSPYSVDASSIVVASNQASFTARVKSSIYPDIKFGFEARVHDDGVVRVRMDEVDGLRKRYDEAASWALVREPDISQSIRWVSGQKDVRAVYGEKKDIEVVVTYEPLVVSLLRNGQVQVVLNGQGLLHMEHFRLESQPEPLDRTDMPEEGLDVDDVPQTVMKVNPNAWFEGDSQDAWWSESFSSWTDSKPKGGYENNSLAHY